MRREPVTEQGHTFCLTSFFLLFLFPLDNIVVHVIIMNLLAERIERKHIISVSNKCAFALTNRPSYCISASPSSCQNGLQFSFLLPNVTLPETNVTEKPFLYRLNKLLFLFLCISVGHALLFKAPKLVYSLNQSTNAVNWKQRPSQKKGCKVRPHG